MAANSRLVRKVPEITGEDVLPYSFYDRPTVTVARELIGRILMHIGPNGTVGGTIVETEAYGPDDPANHAYRGETARNRLMFGPPGFAYVYRIYGIHWCLNAVTGGSGTGEAVLIRALEPTVGLETMRINRPGVDDRRLCRGPGALCSALGITGIHNGADLTGPILIISGRSSEPAGVTATTRIGITKAADRPWRFVVDGNLYVSGTKRQNAGEAP